MLIATLKNLGAFPCASCETPLKYIHMLGTTADEQRRAHKRVDNDDRQDRVENSRRWIFENGNRVDSTRVKDCLGPHSIVPTRVSGPCNIFNSLADSGRFRTLFLRFQNLDSTSMTYSHRTSCTSSSSVYGSEYSYISFEFSSRRGETRYRRSTLGTLLINRSFSTHFARRYRLIAPFGKSTIRRFPQSTAAMTKLAARDYEDILLVRYMISGDTFGLLCERSARYQFLTA